MRQRLIKVKEQQLVDAEVPLLEVERDLPAPDLFVVDLLHVLQEVNRLENMDGEFTYHVALELAVLFRHIVLNLIMHHFLMQHSPVPLPVFLLAVLGFEVTENHLLIRHRSSVSVN